MPADEDTKRAYVNELIEEIKAMVTEDIKDDSSLDVDSIFIGGGTPSILSGEDIKRILYTVDLQFNILPGAEISIEANPGTIEDDSKCQLWKQAGINRVSLGLQSAIDDELKLLGRIHSFADFKDSFGILRRNGFDNINVDLMSALPGQDKDSWRYSVEQVLLLEPEHISAYGLIIEEGTPFHEKYSAEDEKRAAGEDTKLLPGEDMERAMYTMTKDILQAAGYQRYEISNYSKPGRECRHNIKYWTGKDYLGLGLGASSLIRGKRYKNIVDLSDYLGMYTDEKYYYYNNVYEEVTTLSLKDKMEEFVFLGLRMMKGIDPKEFNNSFAINEFAGQAASFENIYLESFEEFERQGLLELKDKYWRLTDKGIDVSNFVLSELLLEDE